MNIILEFKENKKNKGSVISYYKKKVCFVAKDSKYNPKDNEIWECFLWAEFDKYILVKPFIKINKDALDHELERVKEFNSSLKKLDSYLKTYPEKFERIDYDDKNSPYLVLKTFARTFKEEKPDWIIKLYDSKIFVKPIITTQDKEEWNFLNKNKNFK
jgi:hypothetical protein